MSKTKLKTKPAVKAVVKPKSKPKAKPLFFASLLTRVLAGEFGPKLKGYYERAAEYHTQEKTVFPREQTKGTALPTEEETLSFMEKHKLTSIPSRNAVGQRIYDEMRVQAG